MADAQQLALLKQGPQAWNEWRARNARTLVDLTEADLTGADLQSAELKGANLTGANLEGANLFGANLRGANLSVTNIIDADVVDADLADADLTNADLAGSNLTLANLRGAKLSDVGLAGTNLTSANLSEVKLDGALLSNTVFGDVDLSQAIELNSCRHSGPSIIDHRTLLRSGTLPLSFLRGCGLPDRLIDYLPSLLNAGPIQFFSCFISYSTSNQDFADRLHADLQARGVRCWFAPHDMKPGKKIHEQIDEAIRVYDRLLLILSKESMSSGWVKVEIAKARRKEESSKRHVMFPIALVPFSDIRAWEQFNADLGEDTAREIREYFLPDFSEWKTNHNAYQRSFEKVVAALKSADDAVSGV